MNIKQAYNLTGTILKDIGRNYYDSGVPNHKVQRMEDPRGRCWGIYKQKENLVITHPDAPESTMIHECCHVWQRSTIGSTSYKLYNKNTPYYDRWYEIEACKVELLWKILCKFPNLKIKPGDDRRVTDVEGSYFTKGSLTNRRLMSL